MTRDRFIDFLVRSVRDHLIDEARAIELLREFDAGTLNLDELPQGSDGNEDEKSAVLPLIPWLISIGLVSSLIKQAPLETQIRLTGTALGRAPESLRLLLRDLLREEFKKESARLAIANLADWQRGMANLIRRNAIQQRMVGAGRLLTMSEIAEVEQGVGRQLAFLSRFADEVALAKAAGEELSEEYIASRSTLYGGNGYAEFFKGEEAELRATTDLSNWVYYYTSVDDDGTCGPCLAAEAAGPYGSDSPYIPYPGEVCLGGARCRCSLQAVYDPAAAIEAAAAVA